MTNFLGHLWLQCVCTLQGHGHIFPNEGLNHFFIMQKTYSDVFFKTLCAYKDIDLLSDVQYLFRALCEWTTFTFC